MRVIVFPHDLAMGGSQLGAIQLAGAMRPLGVESVIFGRLGPLNERIDELGIEFVEAPAPGRRPSCKVVRALRRLAIERGAHIVHGYEWPPTLEAVLATRGLPTSAVSTVMSMAVAPFIPTWVPLVVGTAEIAAAERAFGRPVVHLMVPPVDLVTDVAPSAEEQAEFHRRHGLGGIGPVVVIVCRLVEDLKLEGILSAIRVAGDLASTHPFQLLIVGDGAARAQVARAADAVNTRTGRRTVVLTGQLADPRVAYAVADLSIGMGSSALRALAFGLPLIVQGERGFFGALSTETLAEFQWRGWFGRGKDPEAGPEALTSALLPLLTDVILRGERGRLGREVAEAASLAQAAQQQLDIYRRAIQSNGHRSAHIAPATLAGMRLGRYYAGRLADKLRGTASVDDFNAARLRIRPTPIRNKRPAQAPLGTIVYVAGSHFDGVSGTDQQLVEALAQTARVIWVDPPHVWRPGKPLGIRAGLLPNAPNIRRIAISVPPGLTRPILRFFAVNFYGFALRRYLRLRTVPAGTVVAASWLPVLPWVSPGWQRILFATDDLVAAADLWRISPSFLHRAREANLDCADRVLAVSAPLGHILQRGPTPPVIIPNGCEPALFAPPSEPAPGVRLRHPIAGLIGQLNERTDLDYLRAVLDADVSLLVVGPRFFAQESNEREFDRLIEHPRMQWIDRVPRAKLPGYLAHMDVGLCPYADTPFNRSASPLKILDYLAAGLPVVCTAGLTLDFVDPNVIYVEKTPEAFAQRVQHLANNRPDPKILREEAQRHSWDARAREFLKGIAP